MLRLPPRLAPLHKRMSSTLPSLKNELASSKSPYLLQHAQNPVHWQEFTPQTISLARQLNKPIFLSSGYSACHWCHVLAHESFEDEETAGMMNEWFVNVKVDREERPDVDRVYMGYLQAVNGGGGWPMSIFMTPNLEPFFAGTYFPRTRFQALLKRINELWEEDQEKCEQMGKGVIHALKDMSNAPRTSASLTELLSTSPASKLFSSLATQHDPRYGGFTPSGPRSRGPKFPSISNTLEPLLRIATIPHSSHSEGGTDKEIIEEAREMGMGMLRGMWKGGIRDWVGGGMARYSVDEKWMVPHFEKMLYDQAQLISASLDFSLLFPPSHPDRKICQDLAADTLKYTLRDLQSPEGGFWSAEDADSAAGPGAKKTEGAFYIWDKKEIDEVLGPDGAAVFESFFGLQDEGNVDLVHDSHGEMRGKNILHQHKTFEQVGLEQGHSPQKVQQIILEGCEKLKVVRDKRERPGLDDKILTAWNGLMLTALSKASTLLLPSYAIQPQCLPTAIRLASFLKSTLLNPTSHELYRSYRQGPGPSGQTDDYAFLVQGLLELYQATGDEAHLLWAEELEKKQEELFWDKEGGGWFVSKEDEHVLVRMKDAQDGAEPSAASTSTQNLSRLSLLLSSNYAHYESLAESTFLSMAPLIAQAPRAVGYAVAGLVDLEKGWREVLIVGKKDDAKVQGFLREARREYRSNQVIIHLDPDHLPRRMGNDVVEALVKGIDEGKEEGASLRVCEGGACGMAVYDLEGARELLG
ncbi:cold-induced thioredoxin domain-containing protein [Cryptococcus wingfieldii CBS 7118]|uniref:Cold-induced thioredoxin domain-containing protein n=1 Tax=Cryptococcus wingfieldii CBS 7118 TaxID=1295528 RepID=A0A1E3HUP4_9TREE|nr:cold-induced thioredoxin domain-containing protein [Cryptococcus wingfieldii CBS 7118]ODN80063.1 cold-induced thioredoxin domain-containing protein [Cryptococcus wingfieldii CBS 7118]